jgi:hypothetical protein
MWGAKEEQEQILLRLVKQTRRKMDERRLWMVRTYPEVMLLLRRGTNRSVISMQTENIWTVTRSMPLYRRFRRRYERRSIAVVVVTRPTTGPTVRTFLESD